MIRLLGASALIWVATACDDAHAEVLEVDSATLDEATSVARSEDADERYRDFGRAVTYRRLIEAVGQLSATREHGDRLDSTNSHWLRALRLRIEKSLAASVRIEPSTSVAAGEHVQIFVSHCEASGKVRVHCFRDAGNNAEILIATDGSGSGSKEFLVPAEWAGSQFYVLCGVAEPVAVSVRQ